MLFSFSAGKAVPIRSMAASSDMRRNRMVCLRRAQPYRRSVLPRSCGHGFGMLRILGRQINGDYRNIVVLAEALRGLGNVTRRLVADLLGALEAEQLTLAVGGLHHAIRKEDGPVALLELERFLLIGHAGNDPQRQPRG